MKGYILDYTVQTNSGIISGDDNQHYNFRGADWMESEPPRRGMRVDFAAVGDSAMEIYVEIRAARAAGYGGGTAGAGTKSKVAAGVLGILLGSLGIHKFYLGYTTPGLILLGITIVGFITAIVLVGIFILIATSVIGLVEGILYLTKTDDEFEQMYVVEKKPWF